MAYFGCSARIALAALVLALSPMSEAATRVSEQQLQQLRQLSPAERDALLRALQKDTAAPRGQVPSRPETFEPGSMEEGPAVAIDLGPPQPPRIKGGDTILVRFTPPRGTKRITPPSDSAPIRAQADETQKKTSEQALFMLDRFGGLVLPEVGRIILAGLNEEEAAARLAVEPAFDGLLIEVKLLPVEKELKPFGYDLFSGAPKTFAPATHIPVPADYIVGPGDTVLVQLFGKQNAEYELLVTRDGVLLFPEIGPIPVAGLTFSQLRQRIEGRVQRQLIGVRASITLGKLRSIRVFVLGDVERPGSYTVSGLEIGRAHV